MESSIAAEQSHECREKKKRKKDGMGASSMTLATGDTQLSVKGDENLMGQNSKMAHG